VPAGERGSTPLSSRAAGLAGFFGVGRPRSASAGAELPAARAAPAAAPAGPAPQVPGAGEEAAPVQAAPDATPSPAGAPGGAQGLGGAAWHNPMFRDDRDSRSPPSAATSAQTSPAAAGPAPPLPAHAATAEQARARPPARSGSLRLWPSAWRRACTRAQAAGSPRAPA